MEKEIVANTRRNPQTLMVANVSFLIGTHDNSKYPLNENEWLRKELVAVKKQVEHLTAKNQ